MANVSVVLQSTAPKWPNHTVASLALGIALSFAEEMTILACTKIRHSLLLTTTPSPITSPWDATLREQMVALSPGDKTNSAPPT
jgi:hypothetical protein